MHTAASRILRPAGYIIAASSPKSGILRGGSRYPSHDRSPQHAGNPHLDPTKGDPDMNMDLRLRTSLSILATLCLYGAFSCSGGSPSNPVGVGNVGGSTTYYVTPSGGSPGTGGASPGTGGSDPGTENSHGCGVPSTYDSTAGLITDFQSVACSAPAQPSLYCFSVESFSGGMQAPTYDACGVGSSLLTQTTAAGMTVTGTLSGPATFHFWFAPCAYVHAYNSIQFNGTNRGADLNVTMAVNTLETTPPSRGGTCALPNCTDPSEVRPFPGAPGGSTSEITAPFRDMSGQVPSITYWRNQVIGFDLTVNVPCGTTTPIDFTIGHFIFFNSPIG
jgi:hypothetical protein